MGDRREGDRRRDSNAGRPVSVERRKGKDRRVSDRRIAVEKRRKLADRRAYSKPEAEVPEATFP
jgi:hypothetical protein